MLFGSLTHMYGTLCLMLFLSNLYAQHQNYRCFRNHLNDIENIIPFVLVGAFYVATQPTPSTALWHFRIFAASRFVHTIAYQV